MSYKIKNKGEQMDGCTFARLLAIHNSSIIFIWPGQQKYILVVIVLLSSSNKWKSKDHINQKLLPSILHVICHAWAK